VSQNFAKILSDKLDYLLDSTGFQDTRSEEEVYDNDSKKIDDYLKEIRQAKDFVGTKSMLVPYRYYDSDNGLYFSDNDTIGFLFEIAPIVGVNPGMMKKIEGFLVEQLGIDFDVQFLLLASDRVEDILTKYLSKKTNITKDQSPFFFRHAEYLKNLATEGREIYTRDFRCFVAFSKKGKSENDLISEVLLQKDKFSGLLKASDIPHIDLKLEEFMQLADEILHPEAKPKRIQHNFLDSLKSHFRSPEYIYGADEYVGLGNLSASIFTVGNLSASKGSTISYGMLESLIRNADSDFGALNCRFMISLSFTNDFTDVKKQNFLTKAGSVQKESEGFFARYNIDIKTKATSYANLTNYLTNNGKIFSSNLQIALVDKPANMVSVQSSLHALASRSGVSLFKESHFCNFFSFMNFLPFNFTSNLKNEYSYYDLMTSRTIEEIACILPINAEWKGTRESGALFVGRKGQILEWSPFTERTNYNGIIVAPSGGGKSVTTQYLIYNMLASGVKIFVLDIGRSYKNICSLLNGNFIEFSLKKQMSLNPFSGIPTDNSEDRDNFLEFATDIVALMVAPSGRINDLQSSILSTAVKEVFDKHLNATTMTHIAEFLQKEGSKEASDLAKMLTPFTKNGRYGKYFEGPATIDFSNQFNVFEFEEIADNKSMLPVIMQIVSTLIVQMFSGNRDKRFMLIIDEAWRVLEKFSSLLERFVRTFRKYGGALWIVTQSYNDFLTNEKTKTIWNNSTWKLFLPHNSDAINSIEKTGDFDSNFLRLLGTLKLEKGKYSEILITSSNEKLVGRLILDKHFGALLSTDAVMFGKLKQLQADGMSIAESIDYLVGAA
jgi:conjugal transfer ATP-binding protein TraC